MMKKLTLLFLFLISAVQLVSAKEIECNLDEIKVKGSYVNPYKRSDGTPVEGYYRKQYCRQSTYKAKSISFEDKGPISWKFKETFKHWNDEEIKTILNTLDRLPPYFKNKRIKSFHRGVASSFKNNPASTLPITNEIVLYDLFFKSKEKERILVHEISHILYFDLTSEEKIKFAKALGWHISPLTPPDKVIYPDSKESPAEDIANNIEAYFYDSERQLKLNQETTKYIKSLIGAQK